MATRPPNVGKVNQRFCMIFEQLTCRSSLRETVLCLLAPGSRRYHCGIRGEMAAFNLIMGTSGSLMCGN